MVPRWGNNISITYFYFYFIFVSGIWRMNMEEAESKGGEEVRKKHLHG
jgi:hypothetical protein